MKLQKLVYYAHAWHLALFDGPLIADRIEAWQYGPVIPALYHEFKEFGNRPITRFAKETNFETLSQVEPQLPQGDSRTKKLISKIWELLGHFTAVQLSNLTHRNWEPWSMLEERRKGITIPNMLIKRCFREQIDQQQEPDSD